jgi:hypothetical protein
MSAKATKKAAIAPRRETGKAQGKAKTRKVRAPVMRALKFPLVVYASSAHSEREIREEVRRALEGGCDSNGCPVFDRNFKVLRGEDVGAR